LKKMTGTPIQTGAGVKRERTLSRSTQTGRGNHTKAKVTTGLPAEDTKPEAVAYNPIKGHKQLAEEGTKLSGGKKPLRNDNTPSGPLKNEGRSVKSLLKRGPARGGAGQGNKCVYPGRPVCGTQVKKPRKGQRGPRKTTTIYAKTAEMG